jgi:hypothetical protein
VVLGIYGRSRRGFGAKFIVWILDAGCWMLILGMTGSVPNEVGLGRKRMGGLEQSL